MIGSSAFDPLPLRQVASGLYSTIDLSWGRSHPGTAC
jgi:hypothetical protein